MDQTKVSAVTEWPIPKTVKDLQRLFGFVNFYQQFIQGFSSIAHSLTLLLKKGPKYLAWNSTAEDAQKKHCSKKHSPWPQS